MRKVIFSGAISLDNYLARPDHGFDWLMWSDEAAALMKDFWTSIDTILMGRKTYEVAVAAGHGGSSPGVTTYVFSKTLPDDPGVNLVRDSAVDFVRDLKARPGKDIFLMGGGELARSLLEGDLVDEIGFSIHPLLLGAGIPLYHPMSRQIDLELIESRPFRNGCVRVTYRVRH